METATSTESIFVLLGNAVISMQKMFFHTQPEEGRESLRLWRYDPKKEKELEEVQKEGQVLTAGGGKIMERKQKILRPPFV